MGKVPLMEVGLALIAAGGLMLWSARAYTDARSDFSARYAEILAARGTPRWLRRIVAPQFGPGVRRAEQRMATTLALAVIVAGCLRLFGVWS
jgi:hypothetical protein